MKALYDAIYTLFTATPANDFYTALSGRMYFVEAPQGVSYPYAIYRSISDVADWTWTTTYDDILLEFVLYSDSAGGTEITNLEKYCIALYDKANLSSSGYDTIRINFDRKIPSVRLFDDIAGKNIWRSNIQFRILLRKQ